MSFVLSILATHLASAGEAPTNSGARAVERALTFLEKDAKEWRKERSCATCHHGTMTVWAMSEAKAQGFAVSEPSLKEFTAWTKDARLKDLDKPRDPRPGFKMIHTNALYLAVMAQNLPRQDAISPEDLKQITGHLLRHQEDVGSWAWSLAPPANRMPPVFESDEAATALGLSVLGPATGSKDKESAEGRRKAEAWLAKEPRTDTTQSLAFRLLLAVRTKQPEAAIRAETERLIARQHDDGGWSQLRGLRSDAYATGEVLYVLNLAGVKRDRPEVRRGVAYLVGSQRADGSWPMTSRAQPGQKPAGLPTPIRHFGSAWATIGLARSVEK